MRNLTLYAAGSLILAANLVALVHAARNRAGQGSEEITFTERELSYFRDADNSGVTLALRAEELYTQSPGLAGDAADVPRHWLDEAKLRELGFDTGVRAEAAHSGEFYQRQVPRAVFVALELNGAAWRQWLDLHSKDEIRLNASRLVAFDGAPDRESLQSRYRDRRSTIIVPAIAQISVVVIGTRNPTAKLVGNITQIPTAIHVPKPFSEPFQALPWGAGATFRVHMKYGSLSEPWVTGVEVDPLPKP